MPGLVELQGGIRVVGNRNRITISFVQANSGAPAGAGSYNHLDGGITLRGDGIHIDIQAINRRHDAYPPGIVHPGPGAGGDGSAPHDGGGPGGGGGGGGPARRPRGGSRSGPDGHHDGGGGPRASAPGSADSGGGGLLVPPLQAVSSSLRSSEEGDEQPIEERATKRAKCPIV